MERAQEPSLPSWAALLGFIALSFLVHAPILRCTFFSDDFEVIGRLRDGGESSFFRPVAEWSLRINLYLTGPSPMAFRTVNLALLGLNAWLVYLLGKRLYGQRVMLLAGLLFVLYPFHLEPQAWIIGRGVAVASAFTLGALVVATGPLSMRWRIGAVAVFGLLGSLSYESALLLPLLLAAWWLIMRPGADRDWRVLVGVSMLVVCVNLMLRWFGSEGLTNSYGAAFFKRSFTDYAAMQVKVVGRSVLPPEPDHTTQAIRFVALAMLVLISVFVARIWFREEPRRRRSAMLLIALFLIAGLVAVIGGVSTRTSESDRFLYLPSAFLCLLLAGLLSWVNMRAMRIGLIVVVLVSWTVLLLKGQMNWRRASMTVERILVSTPEPPAEGRLIVRGLPGDHRGAYIFRHGYRDALRLSGVDVERVLVDETGTMAPLDGDQVVHWNGQSFETMRGPASLEP